jgi:predicted nucleic acid-binding protein
MAGVVVLDSGALIALYDSKDLHHKWALQMFTDTVGDELVMSALTYAEVLVHPIRAGQRDKFERSIKGLGIRIASFEPQDAGDLAELRWRSNLKMPDAVVLHQALKLKGCISTTDRAIAQQARKFSVGVFSSTEF